VYLAEGGAELSSPLLLPGGDAAPDLDLAALVGGLGSLPLLIYAK
jgi:hypothetical protein